MHGALTISFEVMPQYLNDTTLMTHLDSHSRPPLPCKDAIVSPIESAIFRAEACVKHMTGVIKATVKVGETIVAVVTGDGRGMMKREL